MAEADSPKDADGLVPVQPYAREAVLARKAKRESKKQQEQVSDALLEEKAEDASAPVVPAAPGIIKKGKVRPKGRASVKKDAPILSQEAPPNEADEGGCATGSWEATAEVVHVSFDETAKKLGFEVNWDEAAHPSGKPLVTLVKPGKEAEQRGIAAGDVLAEINGMSTNGASREDLKPLLKARPLELKLERAPGGAADKVVSDSGSESDKAGRPQAASDRSKAPANRHQADLALLAAAGAGGGSAKTATKAQQEFSPPDRPPANAAAANASPEDVEGEDSVEEGENPEQVSVDRFDRDMGLVHQQHRKRATATGEARRPLPKPEVVGNDQLGTGGVAEDDDDAVVDDEEIARQLQAEYDADAAARGHSRPPAAMDDGVVQDDDEALARRLQAECDAADAAAATGASPTKTAESGSEAESAEGSDEASEQQGNEMSMHVEVPPGSGPGSTLHVQAPDGQVVEVTVPPGHGPGSVLLVHVPHVQSPSSGSTSRARPSAMSLDSSGGPLDPSMAGANLLDDDDLLNLCTEEVWQQRLQKLHKAGTTCSKVARNGKCYKRKFWLWNGYLKTNGRRDTKISLVELTGIYRGSNSPEFSSMRAPAKRPSLLWRSAKKSGAGAPDPQVCCVLALKDRSFSLFFASSAERDEFVETTAVYVKNLDQAFFVGANGKAAGDAAGSDDEDQDDAEGEASSSSVASVDGKAKTRPRE